MPEAINHIKNSLIVPENFGETLHHIAQLACDIKDGSLTAVEEKNTTGMQAPYENSLEQLYLSYVYVNERLAAYYKYHSLSVTVSEPTEKHYQRKIRCENLDSAKKLISGNTCGIHFIYEFRTFCQKNKKAADTWRCNKIEIAFALKHYSVTGVNLCFDKPYTDELSEEEILLLISEMVNHHKNDIEHAMLSGDAIKKENLRDCQVDLEDLETLLKLGLLD